MEQDQLFYQAVARSFSRAASSYQHFAKLQASAAQALDDQLDWIKGCPEVWLDLGSGTGFMTDRLRQRMAKGRILSVDLAEGMLLEQQSQGLVADYIQANSICLPFANGSIDSIVVLSSSAEISNWGGEDK